MAWDAPGAYQYTFNADVDLSNAGLHQFLVVCLRPAQNVAGHGQGNTVCVPYAAAENKVAFGIIQNTAKLGDPCTVMTQGYSRCIAAGTWEGGDTLKVQDGGHLVKASAGDDVFAVACESAVTGDTTTCYLR